MPHLLQHSYSVFDGPSLLTTAALAEAALVARQALQRDATAPVLIFDNSAGRTIDVDMRGSDTDIVARLPAGETGTASVAETEDATLAGTHLPRSRGRPKLGVVAREVTLLPRHWDWLATQPGGASVALRRLVEEARRTHAGKDAARRANERAYHYMVIMAGNLPGFEEATRALFKGDQTQFATLIAAWPADVRRHALWLAGFED